MVTILMVYVYGSQKTLEVTLKSMSRHDAGYPYRLKIVTDRRDVCASNEVSFFDGYDAKVSYDVGIAKSGSGQHSRLLDEASKDVDTEFLMTMDSDCFPVADGWLAKLIEMQGDGIATTGILWPWIPPPEDIGEKTIEWRIRRQHNWNNTQPACQVIRTGLFHSLGLKFADPDGDDTNFGLMDKVHSAGLRCAGLMPTRCPLSDYPDFDPEFNRYESIIFGDMVYHHVGASRERIDDPVDREVAFKKSRDRVYEEFGAEWMLEDGMSHRFKMDMEERVAKFKMKMLYDSIPSFLEKNSSLFGGGWT